MSEPLDTDAARVAECLRGDLAGFEALVRKYDRVLFAVALRLLGDYEDARDVTQNTFIRAFEHLESYDPRRRFFSWIYRIAVNESLNLRRSRRPHEDLPETIDAGSGQFERLEAAEQAARIRRALTLLPDDYREVIVLRHFAELSYLEISEATGVPEQTVKSRLFSARQRLARLLGPPGDTRT